MFWLVVAGNECTLSHGEAEAALHPLAFRGTVCQMIAQGCRGAEGGCCYAHSITELMDAGKLQRTFVLAPSVHNQTSLLQVFSVPAD